MSSNRFPGEIFRIIALMAILFSINTLVGLAQEFDSCPTHSSEGMSYVNPLYDRYLSAYDVNFYHISLEVSNTNTKIDGFTQMQATAVKEMDTLVLELQDALTVTDIILDKSGHPDFKHRDNILYIPVNNPLNKQDSFQVTVFYHGEAGQNRGFFAGISTEKDTEYEHNVTYTLSEPLNARDWFPVKQVLEDKIDSAWIDITCNQELMAGSNGILEAIENISPTKHMFRWRTHYPIAYYLLSFAVADYNDFSFYAALSGTGDSVRVQNYIYDHPDLLPDWEDDIRATGSMITLYSGLFMDYPFAREKYGHCMAPMGGGMEHQTMTTLHNFDFFLVAHELAHQWFGDYVTCGNWQDIWINEGFASYMEYVAAQHMQGKIYADAWMSNAMALALGERSGSVFVPEEDVTDNYRLFDYGLTYKKGAVLLHMIRFILQEDSVFFNVFRTYLQRYGAGLATGDNFRSVLEEVSGRDFSCFFDQWYYGEGYPQFNVSWYQEGDSLILYSEQTTSSTETPLFRTPFEVEIVFNDKTRERVRLYQGENQQRFAIPVKGIVRDLLFDPDNFLLKTVTVIHQIPSDKAYIFGPNPVTNKFFIEFRNGSDTRELTLSNLNGQELMHTSSTSNPIIMDFSTLTAGSYLLLVTDAGSSYLEQIVKVEGN